MASTDYGTIDRCPHFSSYFNGLLSEIAPWAKPGAVVNVAFDIEKSPAPAWYEVTSADVYVNLSQLDLDPKFIEALRLRLGPVPSGMQKQINIVQGVVVHELAHSRWTDWMMSAYRKIDHRTYSTMELFEEGRIERNAVNMSGRHAITTLRAAFSKVLLPGFMKDSTASPYAAAGNYALVAGRVHAGHIQSDEITAVETAIRTYLGDDIVDALEDILAQAVQMRTYEPHELRQYIALAEEWNALLKDEFGDAGEPVRLIPPEAGDTEEAKEGGGEGTPVPKPLPSPKSDDEAESESDDSEGEGEGEEGDGGESDGEGADGEADESKDDDDVSGLGSRDSVTDFDGDEPDDPWLDDLNAEQVLQDALKALAAVTDIPLKIDPGRRSKPSEFAHVFTDRTSGTGASWRVRQPEPAERRAATLLTHLFEEMSTPAIIKARSSSQLPPGRLRSREAVRLAADRAAGRMSEARPWRTEKRRHDTAPPITVGIATDTSGSMKWAENMVASTAWIFATAGHRIGAQVASVTFGNTAEAVVKPRELPQTVKIRRANGGIEAFDDAMAALDGVLHYTNGKAGRKVLVIVSDGYFVRADEENKRAAWIRAILDAGVEVIWMNNHSLSVERMMKADGNPEVSVLEIMPGDFNGMVRAVTSALSRH